MALILTTIKLMAARQYGIATVDDVIIETRCGIITQKAHITDTMDPRVLCAAHGWWFPEGSPDNQYDWDKANFNMFTSTQKLGREYGTPNLKGLGCRISRG